MSLSDFFNKQYNPSYQSGLQNQITTQQAVLQSALQQAQQAHLAQQNQVLRNAYQSLSTYSSGMSMAIDLPPEMVPEKEKEEGTGETLKRLLKAKL